MVYSSIIIVLFFYRLWFNACTIAVKVDYSACWREEHQNDSFHYHCELQLIGCKKWLSVKNRIVEEHGIQVNFSDLYNPYLPAYSCVSKSNQEVAHSENHLPGLLTVASLKTEKSQDFVLPVLQKGSPQKKNFFVVLQKIKKLLPARILQNLLKKGISKATLNFLLLLWSAELLARWKFLNSYSKGMKKYSVTLFCSMEVTPPSL